MAMPHFANARSIRNAIDRARLRQANRLFAGHKGLTKRDLKTIAPEDIKASSVLKQGVPDSDAVLNR